MPFFLLASLFLTFLLGHAQKSKYLRISVYISGWIDPVTLFCVSLERCFLSAELEYKCCQFWWWRLKWNKGQHLSQPITIGTDVDGLMLCSMWLKPQYRHDKHVSHLLAYFLGFSEKMVIPKTNMSLFWTKMAENNLEKIQFWWCFNGKHAFLKVFISGSIETQKCFKFLIK